MSVKRQALLGITFLLLLPANQALADPVEDFPRWSEQEEKQFASHLQLPKAFDVKNSGGLRAVIYFHVTRDGHAFNFRTVQNDRSVSPAKVTIPKTQFAELEKAMIAAVKDSEPLTPVPASFLNKGEGVKFAYSPHSEKHFKVTVVSEQKL